MMISCTQLLSDSPTVNAKIRGEKAENVLKDSLKVSSYTLAQLLFDSPTVNAKIRGEKAVS
jgi:hypothetical protein